MRSDCVLLEPSATFRRLCTRVLAEREIQPCYVDDVGSALQAIRERTPVLVISSGFPSSFPGSSLVAALRESPSHRAIPIVMISGNPEQCRRGAYHRPDALIAKDSDFETNLRGFLDEIGLEEPRVGEGEERPLNLDGCLILLAEDSRVNQVLTSRILHAAGAEVVVVENGRDAVDASERTNFRLILMDIEMPEMDGREATRLLRAAGVSLPILAMTGHDAETFGEEAKEIGFDGVLPKMLPRGELVKTCIDHLSRASRGSSAR